MRRVDSRPTLIRKCECGEEAREVGARRVGRIPRARGQTGVEDVFGPDDGDGDLALAPLVVPFRLERPELLKRYLPT